MKYFKFIEADKFFPWPTVALLKIDYYMGSETIDFFRCSPAYSVYEEESGFVKVPAFIRKLFLKNGIEVPFGKNLADFE